MSKRSFEMYQYRQVLLRMRQGDSDREIARAGLMGRPKSAAVRALAISRGWLEPATPLPDDDELAAVFASAPRAATCVSTLEPYRVQIERWIAEGIQGTTIHAALVRNHGYRGSYSAVRRFLQAHAAAQPPQATMRLDFAPGDAVQVDFLGDNTWFDYAAFPVPPGTTVTHLFPVGFHAHWAALALGLFTIAASLLFHKF